MAEVERIVPIARAKSTTKGPVESPVKPFPGYPAIEQLVQSGDFRALNLSFSEIYDKLEHISTHAKGFGKAGQAKKALHSLELTVDLLRQMVQMKQTLAKQKAQAARPINGKVGRKI